MPEIQASTDDDFREQVIDFQSVLRLSYAQAQINNFSSYILLFRLALSTKHLLYFDRQHFFRTSKNLDLHRKYK
jgi:hypothetical protein